MVVVEDTFGVEGKVLAVWSICCTVISLSCSRMRMDRLLPWRRQLACALFLPATCATSQFTNIAHVPCEKYSILEGRSDPLVVYQASATPVTATHQHLS
jgi:uncharacterized metal-binding protein